jgi:integrase
MPRRGTRVSVADNIYRDAGGFEVVGAAAGKRRSKRFPKGTALSKLLTEQKKLRAALVLDLAPTAEPASLSRDVETYLATLPAGTHQRNARTELAAWVHAGHLSRAALTAPVIEAQLHTWAAKGIAASTINHRRRALIALGDALDGRTAPNPARSVPKHREPRPEPRGLPWPVVTAILDAMPDRGRPADGKRPTVNLTKLRLWVIATTGWPHAILARLDPKDVHLGSKPYALIRPRRKGKGIPARTLPLTPAAVAALKALDAAKGWGPFSPSAMYQSFQRAVTKAKAAWKGPWPAHIRPYDLRHTFGTMVYAATKDLRATQEVMLHASLSTTARYAEAAVTATATHAVQAVAESQGTRDRGPGRATRATRNRAKVVRKRA